MRISLLLGLLAALLVCPSARAAVVIYGNSAAFNGAAPGLPVEGFQNANTALTSPFNGPLNSATSNAVFSPGDILPGINITDSTPGSVDLFLAGVGQSSNPSLAVGSNFPGSDALILQFSPGVNAVAFDLFQNFGGGAQSGVNQVYVVSLFDTSNVLIGAFNVNVGSGTGGFFGGISDTTIGSISILGPGGAFEVIDNVHFGLAAVPEPASLLAWTLLSGVALAGYRLRRSLRAPLRNQLS